VVAEIINELEGAVAQKGAKLKQILSTRKQDEDLIKQYKRENEDLNDYIKKRTETISTIDQTFKKYKERIDVSKREITPENMKKVFAFLEKRTAEPVAFLMESFIGLMRGQRKADTKSVEIYLKKHEGFMIGVNRLDYKQLNIEHCNAHLLALMDTQDSASKGLGKGYEKQLSSPEFAIFVPYLNVFADICRAGVHAEKLRVLEEQCAAKQAKINANTKEMDKIENLLKSVIVVDLI
jgi:uncharacterized protein YifE (UPF0438 family)